METEEQQEIVKKLLKSKEKVDPETKMEMEK